MKGKILALILAVLMVLPTFVACSNNPKETEDESKKPAQSDVPADDGSEGNYRGLEKTNLNGFTFKCYGGSQLAEDYKTNGGVGNVEFFHIDDYVGDDFFDAMYTRFVNVASDYNVKFSVTGDVGDGIYDIIKQSLTAGTRDYNMCYIYLDEANNFVNSNYLYNFYDLDVDPDDPWWDKGAQDVLTINNKMFTIFSAISFSHYESGALLFYNEQLLENKNIKKGPYDLWKEGKWTLDALINMTEKAATDTNNDGKYRKGADILGLTGQTLRNATTVLASGKNFIKWDDEAKTYKMNFTDETLMAIGDATRTLWVDSNWNDGSGTGAQATKIFQAGKVVFISDYLGQFRNYVTGDQEFSMILWPAYEENAQIKVHLRNPTGLAVLSDNQPNDIKNLSIILNALAAYTYDYIMEDYVKYAVVAKSSKDERSAEVVRYALENTAYDIAAAFGLGAHYWWDGSVEEGIYASTQRERAGEFQGYVKSFLASYFPEDETESGTAE